MDKNLLLGNRLAEDKVEIPDLGYVRVRALARGEVFDLRHKNTKNPGDLEIATITMCLVEPELTAAEVRQWYYAAPSGEIEVVFAKIRELSGLDEGAQKSDRAGADDG